MYVLPKHLDEQNFTIITVKDFKKFNDQKCKKNNTMFQKTFFLPKNNNNISSRCKQKDDENIGCDFVHFRNCNQSRKGIFKFFKTSHLHLDSISNFFAEECYCTFNLKHPRYSHF